MLVNTQMEHPEPDQDDESAEVLLPGLDTMEATLHDSPPPQIPVLFSSFLAKFII